MAFKQELFLRLCNETNCGYMYTEKCSEKELSLEQFQPISKTHRELWPLSKAKGTCVVLEVSND